MVQMPRGADAFSAGSLTGVSLAAGSFVAGTPVVGAFRGTVVFAVPLVAVSARGGTSALRVALVGVGFAVGSLLEARVADAEAPVGVPEDRTVGAALGLLGAPAEMLEVTLEHRVP